MRRVLGLALVVVFFTGLMLLAGCQTTKNVVNGVADGIPQDIKNTSASASKVDAWMQKNAW